MKYYQTELKLYLLIFTILLRFFSLQKKAITPRKLGCYFGFLEYKLSKIFNLVFDKTTIFLRTIYLL